MSADIIPFRPRHDDDPSDRGVTPPDAREHVCANGWTLTSSEDHPQPCPRCKPHLARTTDRAGTTAWRTKRTAR